VGILPEWGAWSGIFDTDHIAIDGQTLKVRMQIKHVTTDSNARVRMKIPINQQKGVRIMMKFSRVMGLLASFVLMSALMACAATPKHESTGEYVDDSVITTRVKAAIFGEKALKTLQINVKTYQGTVQLSGFVDSAQSVTKAGEVARSVKNVTSVKNELLVK